MLTVLAFVAGVLAGAVLEAKFGSSILASLQADLAAIKAKLGV